MPNNKFTRAAAALIFTALCAHGGVAIEDELLDGFLMFDPAEGIGKTGGETDAQIYGALADWTGAARGKNPRAFDAAANWMLDDAKWGVADIAENERIFIGGILGRFKKQNFDLRAILKKLEPSGVVNKAVFAALDKSYEELSGGCRDEGMRKALAEISTGFSAMTNRAERMQISGRPTGPHGTDSVDSYGFMNILKDCDAGVQWALFMPRLVQQQQRESGVKEEDFECHKTHAMRFIGFDAEAEHGGAARRAEKMRALDAMADWKSGFDHDLLLTHHGGPGVDIAAPRAFLGRFMRARAPAPDGFVSFDFEPEPAPKAEPPFIPQFACAHFPGSEQALRAREGFDAGAMYDITRNIILGEGAAIPYPGKYWTAEVFTNGCAGTPSGFLFSVAR